MKWNLDLGDDKKQTLPLAGRKSVSILLGAGFSVPSGYPTGGKVNEALLNFNQYNIAFSAAGELMYSKDGQRVTLPYDNQFQRFFIFCIRLITQYSKDYGSFDYEAFYDFIKSKAVYNQQYRELCEDLLDEFNDYRSFVNGIEPIYNQMVAFLIHDKYNETWNDERPSHLGYVEDYDGFLKALIHWSKDSIVNVHTLNHDLLFESFRKTDYMTGLISDGFDEYGSRYYGVLQKENASFNVRLERYKGRYNTPIRLYKLHGSLDYILYKRTDKNGFLIPDCYIKIKKYINPGYLMRSSGNKIGYERYPFAYHSDFLTGTTSKINRYNEPLLYKKLFRKFRNNLRSAQNLIMIGYGGRDTKINEIIAQNFDYQNKKAYVIDPYPSDDLKAFANKIRAKIIEKSIAEVSEEELISLLL